MIPRNVLAVAAEVLLLIGCFALIVYSSQVDSRQPRPRRPADAVEDAHTPREVDRTRSEQLDKHDQAARFAIGN